jgi:hypothetical protein
MYFNPAAIHNPLKTWHFCCGPGPRRLVVTWLESISYLRSTSLLPPLHLPFLEGGTKEEQAWSKQDTGGAIPA